MQGVFWWGVSMVVAVVLASWAEWRHQSRQHVKFWHHSVLTSTKVRMTYNSTDVADYAVMVTMTSLLGVCCFGFEHWMTELCFLCSAWLLVSFILRHGATFKMPRCAQDPHAFLRMLYYKIDNARTPLLVSAAGFVVEQLVIVSTPMWEHNVPRFRETLLAIFTATFCIVTVIRSLVLAAHIYQQDQLFDFLESSPWKKVLGRSGWWMRYVHLLHAFVTGIQCHILAVAPLYLLIYYGQHSMVLLPLRACFDVVIYGWWLRTHWNDWLYRDHWISHHDELEFVYLHGPHHDALPISLMAAHDTGMLEGFLRFSLGLPEAFAAPLLSVPLRGFQVLADMVFHQYVPGENLLQSCGMFDFDLAHPSRYTTIFAGHTSLQAPSRRAPFSAPPSPRDGV
eukprot:m.199895 g.199895  ORF g.199895 m.199895 type:complete len:395 (-) comp15325_c0_seq10:164-1348(-)